MGKLFRSSMIAVLLAATYVGAGCQNVQPVTPKANAPKRNLNAQTNPIPETPVGDNSPRPSIAPTTPASTTPSAPPSPSIPPIVPSASPTPIPSIAPGTPSLLGLVSAPASIVANNGSTLISNNGGGLLSNNSGSLIANNGGGLLSNNGSGLIANNGGGLVSNNGSGYHVLAAGGLAPTPLSNAFLYLTNRDEKFFFNAKTNQVFSATSDATGKYLFPITADNGFPVDKDVVVNVVLNDNQRLTGYIVPKNGENSFEVDIATTLATELLRGDAYRSNKKLSDYHVPTFQEAVALTRQAIAAGDLPATAKIKDTAGVEKTVSAYNLQLQSVEVLRNEYMLVLSAAKKANTLVKSLSDKWKQILGHRPSAVTTYAGNGNYPKVALRPYPPDVEGDHRGANAPGLLQVPMGQVRDVAIASTGDIFVTSDGSDLNDAHIRWIKPDGKVSSLWLPNFTLRDARGIVIEKEPTGDPNNPGSVLVAGGSVSLLWRVYIVDTEIKNGDGTPKFPMEIVSGLYIDATNDAAHPEAVDGVDAYLPASADTPKNSHYRLYEEGERKYVTTGATVPNAARYAHLDGLMDVVTDEQGNIYLCEQRHHRIRMIPKADGTYFGYRKPVDANNDGIVDSFGAATPMKAGNLYTIAGNPRWDTTKTPASTTGRWFGEYGGDNGPAQEAKLDSPSYMVFHNGALYVTDTDNQRVRKIDRATGTITSVAGNPTGAQANTGTSYYYQPGSSGEGGPAAQAQLSYPRGLAIDAQGRLFVAETGYGRIRMIDASGTIKTVAGRLRTTGDDGTSNTGDGAALNWADLLGLDGMAFDPEGNLVFTDEKNFRIRRLWRQWE